MLNKARTLTVGLFDRVYPIFKIVEKLSDEMSEEEIEGLLKVLPGAASATMKTMLKPKLLPASIAFLDSIRIWLKEAKVAKESGKKFVLIPFNFPPELIHSFDSAFPLTSEIMSTFGVVALEGQGERYWDFAMDLGLPDYICSSNTIELGSVLMGPDLRPDIIVSSSPGACDVNSKIHEFVSLYYDIPHLLLEKPTDSSNRGFEIFKLNYRKLIRSLEEIIGEELDYEKMKIVAERANRCTELYMDLWELKRLEPCPVPGVFNVMIYGTRFAMWGREEGCKVLEKCLEVSKRNIEDADYQSREEIARAVWVYTSYYFDFLGFFDWMEENGIVHLGDGLLLCFPEPIDTSSKDSIIDGFAKAAWNMPMTRQVGGTSMLFDWLDDIIEAVNSFNANCAIYSGHHACKQTWSVFSSVRSELMKRTGIPTLSLQGDSWIGRMTPMSVIQNEISQFVDNVVTKKKVRQRRYRRVQEKQDMP